MEGLIPFVYRSIVHFTNGDQTPVGNPFLNEAPPGGYVRLAGDSGRFQPSDRFFTSSSADVASSNAAQSPRWRPTAVSSNSASGTQSPRRRSVPVNAGSNTFLA
ncbi:hypothetical protein LUZ60_012927 [Juncus effusus]|nr:hypothetical protein LUZ60_012927 [Juncus effusus]